jgi:hypothetical protein
LRIEADKTLKGFPHPVALFTAALAPLLLAVLAASRMSLDPLKVNRFGLTTLITFLL